MHYPFQLCEIPLDDPKDMKKGTKITFPKPQPEDERSPLAVTIGMNVKGVMYIPDKNHGLTAASGAQKRICFAPPQINEPMILLFEDHVREEVKEFTPLPFDCDLTIRTWLEESNYQEWRKKELEEASEQSLADYVLYMFKSFIKEEPYMEPKHARTINAPCDKLKTELGPAIKRVEKIVFSDDWFIKKIPMRDRPKYISDRIAREGATYLINDFSSFEASIQARLAAITEVALYEHMFQNLPVFQKLMEFVRKSKLQKRKLAFKRFFVFLVGTRMSGEMDTSLGNGFLNKMLILFFAKIKGARAVGVVEGDDSLIRWEGPLPTKQDFAQLGFIVKLEVRYDIETASFCGLIFDPTDMLNVTDPIKVLLSFGWIGSRYINSNEKKLKALLRCKALSLAHQYPGCPIISTLAYKVLALTSGFDVSHLIRESRAFGQWERDKLLEALECGVGRVKTEPPPRTRLLVERVFHIPISVQIHIEEYLDTITSLKELDEPVLNYLVSDFKKNYEDYVLPYARENRKFTRPKIFPIILQPFDEEIDGPAPFIRKISDVLSIRTYKSN